MIEMAEVSYWVIPGGSDYDRAWVKKEIMPLEMAKEFVRKYGNPPEMAFIIRTWREE